MLIEKVIDHYIEVGKNKKVRELPENSTRLYHRGVLRSRAVRTVLSDPGPPSVLTTVEASDDAHLSFINT